MNEAHSCDGRDLDHPSRVDWAQCERASLHVLALAGMVIAEEERIPYLSRASFSAI